MTNPREGQFAPVAWLDFALIHSRALCPKSGRRGVGGDNNARTKKVPTCQTWKQSQERSTKSIARKSEESRSTATRSRSGKSSAQTHRSRSRVKLGLPSHTKRSTAAAEVVGGAVGRYRSDSKRRAKSNGQAHLPAPGGEVERKKDDQI